MHKVTLFMTLMKKVYFILNIHLPNPEVFGEVFEKNYRFIDAAEFNKLSRRKKHTYIMNHSFQSFVQKKIIRKCYIDTQEQTSKFFTKPLDEELFIYL